MNAEIVISYASRDGERPEYRALLTDLAILGRQEWHDDKLTGGLPWWEDILNRIAHAHILLIVMSKDSLRSVACRREVEWGLKVKRKVLPIMIDAVTMPDELRALEAIDYTERHADPDAASRCMARLASAVAALEAAPDEPLPAPLPQAPEVPPTYGGVLDRYVEAPLGDLSLERQREMVEVAGDLVRSDEGDHEKLAERLKQLLGRSDLTRDSENSLKELQEEVDAGLGEKRDAGDDSGHGGDGKWKVETFQAPRVDLWKLAKHLQSWYETQGMTAELSKTRNGEVVIDCHSVGRARATGAGASVTLVLSRRGDRLEVSAGAARWVDKAASAGAALVGTVATGGWGWPLLAPSVVGGYRQSRIAKRTFKYIEEVIPLCNRG